MISSLNLTHKADCDDPQDKIYHFAMLNRRLENYHEKWPIVHVKNSEPMLHLMKIPN